ncbi:MAG: GIY-YIG nuclease family protein, partial [Patescibacteria group bacterium]
MTYFVYAIYNQKHDKFYVGQTFDIAKRLDEHNKKVLKGYTSQFDGPWILIYKEEVSSRQEALKREKQLKSFRGREFVKKQINSLVA